MAFNSHKWIRSFKRSKLLSQRPISEILKIAGKEVKTIDKEGDDPEKWSIVYTDGSSEPYLKHIRESVYDNMLKAVPDNYSYKKLAMDIANMIKDEYGAHNVEPFQKELAKYLKQQSEAKLPDQGFSDPDQMREDDNIFSADDEQSWPSGPFGKKDDYADEAGSSYKRAKDWQIDKPGKDGATKGTGYKA